jgi:peptidase C39-like protein
MVAFLKSIAISLFALLLLGGSACTKVHVFVRVPSSTSSLTGLNCKLQRELRNQEQRTDFWCWAAAAQTVIEYLKQEPVRQCELVEAVLRNRSLLRDIGDNPPAMQGSASSLPCCTAEDDPAASLADPPCPANGLSEYVFDTPEFRMGYLPVTFDWTSSEPQGLPWEEIVTEICDDRPIVSAIAYSEQQGSGGHAVVIGGYKELQDGSQWLQVYDPGYSTLEGESYLWSYGAYLGIPGVFAHARDYKFISVQH